MATSGITRTPSSIIWGDKTEEPKEVDGWLYCGRYALVILNVFFFVSHFFLLVLGALLIGYGLWFLLVPANQNLMIVITSSTTKYYADLCMLVIIGVGICTMIFAQVGCCGAVSNNKCVLGLFFLLLIVLFVGLAAIIGFTIWLRFEIDADIQKNMMKSLMESYKGDNATNAESVAWNAMQSGFQCCGVAENGFSDYTKTSPQYPDGSVWYMLEFAKTMPAKWPESCCKAENDRARCTDPQSQPEEVIYMEGCKEKVEDFINNSLLQASGIGAALILIEIIHFVTVKKLEAALNNGA